MQFSILYSSPGMARKSNILQCLDMDGFIVDWNANIQRLDKVRSQKEQSSCFKNELYVVMASIQVHGMYFENVQLVTKLHPMFGFDFYFYLASLNNSCQEPRWTFPHLFFT